MDYFELEPADITALSASDLRELVARLSEAEVMQQGRRSLCVTWGGAQEAPDGGLDVRVEDAGLSPNDGFVPRGYCGFQVKKHTMGEAACRGEMLENGLLRPVIADLADRNGAYIIVSGKDDCSDSMLASRLRGLAGAVESLPNKANLHLDFYGRDRLATWLRRTPSVALWARARLGRPLSGWRSFGRWAATPREQDDAFLVDDHPCVIDANASRKAPMPVSMGIEVARDRLRNPGSAVRITGLSGVGKTRFAQALFEAGVGENSLSPARAIYADLGERLVPTASELVSYLIVNGHAVHLILDNCPPDVHRQLQKQVSESEANLSLLTIEYDISDDRPEETAVIHLEPCSEKTVSTLIQKRFPDLERINADTIAEFAGGNSRIAIALASRVHSDETLTNFTDEELFRRLFSQRKGPSEQLLGSAEILSLVYSFNLSNSAFNDELRVLGSIAGLDRRLLHQGQAELLRRQLAQRRGEWRAVLPHALANRLAKRALENISPDEINAELLKPENRRLFVSCAHRLGYLHNFEPALQLASAWVAPGGILHDIGSYEEDKFSALQYIAPVFPDTVLGLLEDASSDPDFASRKNKNFALLVRLLSQLAYDDDKFDRAVCLMLKFADGEASDERSDSVVSSIRQLFSLHLSGTQATPTRRRACVRKLLASGSLRHREIAGELLRAAFEASHWTSFASFEFGARHRGYGWSPSTNEEQLGWYVGFLQEIKPALASQDQVLREWARELVALHFRGLWTYAGCYDALEEIVFSHTSTGGWPKVWMAIKRTLSFDGDDTPPEIKIRLEALEDFSAPIDLYSEIEAYVLTNIWDHVEGRGNSAAAKHGTIEAKIVSLGEAAAADLSYVEFLGPKIWEGTFDALESFGAGLARGSSNQIATFEQLADLLQQQAPQVLNPILLYGYIRAVYETNADVGRLIQERVFDHSLLRPYFVYLLGASDIAPWGVKKLLEIAREGKIEARRFGQLAYGRMHEPIPDKELSELLLILNEQGNGFHASLDILRMRFFIREDSGYVPSEELLSVGRSLIRSLLSVDREQYSRSPISGMDRIASQCLKASVPAHEIKEIVRLLCSAVNEYRIYCYDLHDLITHLVINFPEVVLAEVFSGDNKERLLVYQIFSDRFNRNSLSINIAPVDRVLAWCQGDQSLISRVASAVRIYSPVEASDSPLEYARKVVLSEMIKSFLEVAKDKESVIERMVTAIQPTSWSGSRADIMETRAKAFAELLDHPIPEVRNISARKLELVEQAVLREREREASENASLEQRFE